VLAKTSTKLALAAQRVDQAIEVFVRALSFTRSFIYPYQAERVGPLWVVRDGPRKQASDYRREEWIAHRIDAVEVDRIARKETRGRFCICAMRTNDEPDGPIRDAYRAIGYRLGSTESLMVHCLKRIPRLPEPFPVERVRTQDVADRLSNAARHRQVHAAHFGPDSPLRQYVALDNGKPIGWARSVVVGDSTWVSSMYVHPKYRRRGIGKSILGRMLRDDRAYGAMRSVLLASHAGAMLYPHVGYELIGELLLYTPKKC
jgi:GNAT superfamily N-acetyltransferase